MNLDDVTLGELGRRMDMLHSDVKELNSTIVKRDDLASVANTWQQLLTAHEAQSKLQTHVFETRLSTLESWNTWAMRIVLGLVIAAVVGLVVIGAPGIGT